jgi:virginiamycin B lyase
MPGTQRSFAFALIGLLALAVPASAQPFDPAFASGAHYYERHCAECHGADGRGTLIGFPLVGRPAGPLGPDVIVESLRFPLQSMPRFDRAAISDDVAKLIAFHIGVLENKASNAAVPAPPQVSAAALRNPPSLPPAPEVAPAPAASYEMQEHKSPCGPGADVGVAPDGRIWFTAIEQHALAVFNPRDAQIRCFPLPTRNSRPHGIAVDRDGFIFLTLTGLPDNRIAMFDPKTELFGEFQMPSKPQPFVYPHAITFDAERNPMFTLEYGDTVGRIDRRTGAVQSLPLTTRYARPTGITVARNGHVLVTEFTGNKLFDYDPKSGKTVEYPHPRAGEDPGLRALATDSKGNIWVAESEFGSIGMFEPRTQRWRSFRAPANGGAPRGLATLTVDARDVVWFAHHGGNYIGRFDPRNESFAVYPHTSKDMKCRALDIGKDGALWCMGLGAPVLMRLLIK